MPNDSVLNMVTSQFHSLIGYANSYTNYITMSGEYNGYVTRSTHATRELSNQIRVGDRLLVTGVKTHEFKAVIGQIGVVRLIKGDDVDKTYGLEFDGAIADGSVGGLHDLHGYSAAELGYFVDAQFVRRLTVEEETRQTPLHSVTDIEISASDQETHPLVGRAIRYRRRRDYASIDGRIICMRGRKFGVAFDVPVRDGHSLHGRVPEGQGLYISITDLVFSFTEGSTAMIYPPVSDREADVMSSRRNEARYGRLCIVDDILSAGAVIATVLSDGRPTFDTRELGQSELIPIVTEHGYCFACNKIGGEYATGVFMCPECMSELTTPCAGCGISGWSVNHITIGGSSYCRDCARVTFFSCHRCDGHHLRGTERRIEGMDFCETCYYSSGTICDCSRCSQTIYRRNRIEYSGDNYCHSCYEFHINGDGMVHRWNYRPPSYNTFMVDGEPEPLLTLGVEVEIEDRMQKVGRGELAGKLMEIMPDNMVYFKEDGSLDNGFEIVTHPTTLRCHYESAWAEAMNVAKRSGYRSYKTSTCGIHVHVPRTFFTRTQEVKLALFVYNNKAIFERVAQRNEVGYSKFKNLKKHNRQCRLLEANYSEERYEAINFQNEMTIEFRLFKGTLKSETFYSYLELVDAVSRFVKEHNSVEVSKEGYAWDKFRQFVDGSEYIYLPDYLKKKIDNGKPIIEEQIELKEATDRADGRLTLDNIGVGDRLVESLDEDIGESYSDMINRHEDAIQSQRLGMSRQVDPTWVVTTEEVPEPEEDTVEIARNPVWPAPRLRYGGDDD